MRESGTTPERTWFAVVRAYQICTRRYESLLASLDLTPPQLDLLSAVSTLGDEAQPNRIADALLVTRGNVTGLLTRLERRKWIRVEPHPNDGRARVVRLTKPGQRLLDRARPVARAFIRAQMAPFSQHDLEATLEVMNRMERHLQQLDIQAVLAESDARSSDRFTQTALL
jgi:DNA-binding MarR family transcriptional regulator